MLGEAAPRDGRRPSRTKPTTSVVIAWSSAPQELDHILGELAPCCQRDGTELIVVRSAGGAQRRRLRRLFPHARIIAPPGNPSITELRQIGAERATGDILIVLDDGDAAAGRWQWRLPPGVVPPNEDQDQVHAELVHSLRQYGVEADRSAASSAASDRVPASDNGRLSWSRLIELVTEHARLRRGSTRLVSDAVLRDQS